LHRDQSGLGRERAGQHQQLGEPALQRRKARRAHRRARDRPAVDGPARRGRIDGGEDRARVLGRGPQGNRSHRPSEQPCRPQDLGSLSLARRARACNRALRIRLGRRGFRPHALRGVSGRGTPDTGAARGPLAARQLREPGAHGVGDRVRARGAAPASEAQQGSAGRAVRVPRVSPEPMLAIRYTAWDGTQQIRLTPEQVFEKLSEDLSFTDDVRQALDWLLHQGLQWPDGMRVMGLDELLEQVREAMRRRHQEVNLREALAEQRRRLDELLDLERDTLEEQGDAEKIARLRDATDNLPTRLSEALERLRGHPFENSDAGRELEALLDDLDDIRDLEDFQRRYGDLFHGPRALSF